MISYIVLTASCPQCGEDVHLYVTQDGGSYWTPPSSEQTKEEVCEHFKDCDGDYAIFTDGSRVLFSEDADIRGIQTEPDDDRD